MGESVSFLLDACIHPMLSNAIQCFHAQTANCPFCPRRDLFTVAVLLHSFPLKAALNNAAHRDATNIDKISPRKD